MHPDFEEMTDSGAYGPFGPDDPSLPLVGIYARVSSDEQVREGHSIPTQLTVGLNDAERKLGKSKFRSMLYIDSGISGALPPLLPGSALRTGRIGLGHLLEDAEKLGLALALFTHQDRLARDVPTSYEVVNLLLKRGTAIRFVDQGIDMLSRSDDRTTFGVNAVLAESERNRLAHRVKAGYWKRRQEGYWVGSPPYGWRREGKANVAEGKRPGLCRVEKEARVIRQVYDWALAGRGDWWIITELRKLGILSPNGKPEWTARTLRTNLRTPCHAGLIEVDGGLVQAQHFDLRIIEPADYHAVQRILDERKRVGAPTKHCNKHLIADIARCDACARRVYLDTSNEGTRFLRCFGLRPHHPEICPGWMCKQVKAERVLLDRIRRLAESRAFQEQAGEQVEEMLSARGKELHAQIKAVEKELADLPRQRDDLFAGFRKNGLPVEKLIEYEKKFDETKAELEGRLAALRGELEDAESSRRRAETCREALKSFNTVWDQLEVDEQRQLLKNLIESLTLRRSDRNTVVMKLKLLFGDEEEIVIPPDKRPPKAKAGIESLTQRQLAVLHLFEQGLSYKEIAEKLGVTPQCVCSTALAARKQLGVSTNEEAIRAAESRIEAELEFLPLEGRSRPPMVRGGKLSPGEIEVLSRLAAGESLCGIARSMGRKLGSMSSRLRSAKKKLGVATREEALDRAKEMGVV